MDSFDLLVKTRTATPEEYPRVAELTDETYSASETGVDGDRFEGADIDWMDEASKGGNEEAAVAYDEATNKIVASGIGLVVEDQSPEKKVGYIRWMSTTEDFRGYGVGEQVLNHLMNWFRKKGVDRVQLHATDKASEFYSQHGFEKDLKTNMWWRKA